MECLTDLLGQVVLVSTEVGLAIIPENTLARTFCEQAGRLNRTLAACCQRVVFITAGLPLILKDNR